MIKALMTPNTDSEMANLLKITEANSSEMKIVLKVMKRRLPGMAIPVVEFSREGLKIRKVFG
jgi:hypothetical protein